MGKSALSKRAPTYRKISATVEEDVLRRIQERTTNVSGFLNEAARDKLYFDRLRELDEELRRKGVSMDENLYQKLNEWADDQIARSSRARARRSRS